MMKTTEIHWFMAGALAVIISGVFAYLILWDGQLIVWGKQNEQRTGREASSCGFLINGSLSGEIINSNIANNSSFNDGMIDYDCKEELIELAERYEQTKNSYLSSPSVSKCFSNTEKFLGVLCGGSMRPFVDCKDEIIVCEINGSLAEVGDVIVFTKEGEQVEIMHRIMEVNENGTFYTKGDNNRFNDNWLVYPEDIKYMVVGVRYK